MPLGKNLPASKFLNGRIDFDVVKTPGCNLLFKDFEPFDKGPGTLLFWMAENLFRRTVLI